MTPNKSEFGLTRMIGMLWCMTDDQVRKASPERAVDRYGVRLEHAAGYIGLERQVRGLG